MTRVDQITVDDEIDNCVQSIYFCRKRANSLQWEFFDEEKFGIYFFTYIFCEILRNGTFGAQNENIRQPLGNLSKTT